MAVEFTSQFSTLYIHKDVMIEFCRWFNAYQKWGVTYPIPNLISKDSLCTLYDLFTKDMIETAKAENKGSLIAKEIGVKEKWNKKPQALSKYQKKNKTNSKLIQHLLRDPTQGEEETVKPNPSSESHSQKSPKK